jgi:hypothetical protein
MSQTLTITIDGLDGRVKPDSVGEILRAVFAVLKSMDERSWAVGTPRVAWKVSEARLVNPLTVTATAESAVPHAAPVDDLAFTFVQQLEQITAGIRPRDFWEKDYKFIKRLGVEARRSRSLVIVGTQRDRVQTFRVPRSFSSQVTKLLRLPKTVREAYSSLDGTLIKLINDPLKNDGNAILRERLSGAEVNCHANPAKTSDMARYVDRGTRVVIYGVVTYEDEVPKKVEVEDFATLPADDSLPSLQDIHEMRLGPPRGMSVEDFLDDTRGDD